MLRKWKEAITNSLEFDSKQVDPDLHKRMTKAVQDGRIRCFDMQEGPSFELSMSAPKDDLHQWCVVYTSIY